MSLLIIFLLFGLFFDLDSDLKSLSCICCYVVKICIKFGRNQSILGGVIANYM